MELVLAASLRLTMTSGLTLALGLIEAFGLAMIAFFGLTLVFTLAAELLALLWLWFVKLHGGNISIFSC